MKNKVSLLVGKEYKIKGRNSYSLFGASSDFHFKIIDAQKYENTNLYKYFVKNLLTGKIHIYSVIGDTQKQRDKNFLENLRGREC